MLLEFAESGCPIFCATSPLSRGRLKSKGHGKVSIEPVRSPKIISGDKRLARLISYIHHTCEYRQFCHVGNILQQCRLGLFQDSDLPEILKSQCRPQEGSCALSEVTRLFPQIGCARSKLLSHTVRRNLKLFLWMRVYAWMELPLLTSGIWLLKCCILLPTNQRNPKRMCWETCYMTHHQENKPRTK